MRFADIDLSRLPEPDVVRSLDFEAQLAEMKAELIALGDAVGVDLRPALEAEGEAALKLLQAFAARELQVRAAINDAAKAVMPAFARSSDLDHLAARNGVERKVVTPGNPDAVPPVEAVMEEDGPFRARMQLALEAFSTAGPEGAYAFHALAVENVRDCAVYGHEDGVAGLVPADVLIIVLSMAEDGAADQALLDAVATQVNHRDVRPIADRVIIEAAQVTDYQIDLELRVLAGADVGLVEAEARKRLDAYVAGNFRVARAHRRTGIGAAAHIDGAVDEVIITSPAADVLPAYNGAARCTAITITTVQVAGSWDD